MEFRRAAEEDWAGIWSIWHRVVGAGDTFCFDPETPEVTARSCWLPPPPAETWVICDGSGAVLGTALLQPNHLGPGSHVANAGFMVDPSHAGRGVGRALGTHILQRARTAGYLAMQFNAVVSTNTRAVALWRSLGFEVIGTSPRAFRHPEHGLVDLLIMHQPLT